MSGEVVLVCSPCRSTAVQTACASQVSQVQRAFVLKLLGFNKFDRQLVAVREINQLLKRSMEISDIDGGKSTQVKGKHDFAEHKNLGGSGVVLISVC